MHPLLPPSPPNAFTTCTGDSFNLAKVLTLEREDAPSGFTLILTFPLGETLKWLLETAAFWAAGFVGLSSSSVLPVAYRDTPYYYQSLSGTPSYIYLNKQTIQNPLTKYRTYWQEISKQWRITKRHGGQGQNLLMNSPTVLLICCCASSSSVNNKTLFYPTHVAGLCW